MGRGIEKRSDRRRSRLACRCRDARRNRSPRHVRGRASRARLSAPIATLLKRQNPIAGPARHGARADARRKTRYRPRPPPPHRPRRRPPRRRAARPGPMPGDRIVSASIPTWPEGAPRPAAARQSRAGGRGRCRRARPPAPRAVRAARNRGRRARPARRAAGPAIPGDTARVMIETGLMRIEQRRHRCRLVAKMGPQSRIKTALWPEVLRRPVSGGPLNIGLTLTVSSIRSFPAAGRRRIVAMGFRFS